MQNVAFVSSGREEPLPLPMVQSLHPSQVQANELIVGIHRWQIADARLRNERLFDDFQGL